MTFAIAYDILIYMDIVRIRKKLKLTQEQLAQRLGVSFTTINRWENNQNKPSPLALRFLKELEKEAK